MDSKPWIYALAASGLVASAIQKADAAPKKKKENVECFGINIEAGSNGCGVSSEKVDLANKVYGNPYTKSAELSKAGKLGECAGTAGKKEEGYLGWIEKKSKEECFKAGGFVYLKDKKDNLQIEDKSGVKVEPKEPAKK